MFTYYLAVRNTSVLKRFSFFKVTISDLVWEFCLTPNWAYYPALVNEVYLHSSEITNC